MYPLTIALAIGAADLRAQAQACLATLPVRVVAEQDDWDLVKLLDQLDRSRPDVLLLDPSQSTIPLESLLPKIRADACELTVFVLLKTGDADQILRALRAGASDVLVPPLDVPLRRALERLSPAKAERRAGQGGGKSLGFVSAKGGCGATTLIVHVAAELGRRERRVGLIDLDLDSGVIAFLTKAKSAYSALDGVNNAHRLDGDYWKGLVVNPVRGVELMAAPEVGGASPPGGDRVQEFLGFAQSQYDLLLVDLGRGLTVTAIAAMEKLDEICLVTTLDIAALHQARKIVARWTESGRGKESLHLIVNRASKRLNVSPADLEKVLGVPVYATIPDDSAEMSEAYAEGVLAGPSSELGRQVAQLAARLGGVEQPAAQRKRAFKLF